MRKIKLTQGKFAVVDDEDFEYLNKFKWQYNKNRGSGGYAFRTIYPNGRREKSVSIIMHRIINKTPDGMENDHINGDGFDNRKKNLRSCSRSENQHNKSMNRNNTSGFKGVSFNKSTGKWIARIKCEGKMYYLGSFREAFIAAIQYDYAARKLFGKFAKLNFDSRK